MNDIPERDRNILDDGVKTREEVIIKDLKNLHGYVTAVDFHQCMITIESTVPACRVKRVPTQENVKQPAPIAGRVEVGQLTVRTVKTDWEKMSDRQLGTAKVIQEIPKDGSLWVHHSGRIYRIITISNQDSNDIGWITTVVYQNILDDARVWSRTLTEFLKKFKPYHGGLS